MSWPLVKIGDVCSLMTGGTPKTTISEYYEDGTVPWIVSGDIHKGEIFDCDKKITELAVENSNARYLPKDSVLIALNGQGKTRGTVALLRASNATCNQSIVSINPNDQSELLSDYLFYFLKSQYRQIRNITGDKDRAGLNMPLIRSIEIPLPPLDEQKRIAAILDKADAIRRKRQQAIRLADDFLRSVFLDMFGDPVTNPKGWEVKKFSDLGNWASGGTPSRSVSGYFEGEINWFSARELNHRYLNESVEKITDAALSKSAAKIFPAGSMLVGMYDTAAFKISILNVASASNQACANIIPNEKIDIEWFFSFIEFSKETYLRQRRGVRQQNLNLGMIKDFDLPLPPKTEQEKFVKLAHKTMQMKERNYSSLSNSLDSFNSLSQKAFAGDL